MQLYSPLSTTPKRKAVRATALGSIEGLRIGILENGKLNAERGSGQFLPCESPDSSKPKGITAPELQAMSRFGLKPLF